MKTKLFELCGILAVCLFVSCNRDKLYYSYAEVANVKLNVDWSQTNITPNGVSAYIFDYNTGFAIGQEIISNDINSVKLELPQGQYDILVINDTEYELENIDFNNTTKLSDFVALIHRLADSKYGLNRASKNVGYATDCDVLAYDLIKEVTIDRHDIDYYQERPSVGGDEHIVYKEITAKPKQVTEVVEIVIDVMNINSAAGAPRSQLTDIVAGFTFALGAKLNDLVIHEFALNNRVIDPDNYKKGRISKRFVCFGPNIADNLRAIYEGKLIMNFALTNGDLYPIEIMVGNILERTHNGYEYINKIHTEITLPESIGNGDGVFNPDVEEWEDVDVEMPI